MTDFCEAYLWKDAIRANAGQTRIETLEQLAKKYDFAVIIFTKADIIANQPLANFSGRDNCVFEAGLFMGVVGRNRCFFLSSVEKATCRRISRESSSSSSRSQTISRIGKAAKKRSKL